MQKTKMKKRCRDGVTCVVLCTLPSIYLVCVVFGTAIPTSFYIFGKCFHTCIIITTNTEHKLTTVGFLCSSARMLNDFIDPNFHGFLSVSISGV